MFDILSRFGKVGETATGTPKEFPFGINMGGGQLGLHEDLFCNFIVLEKPLLVSDTVKIEIFESATTGSGTLVVSQTFPQKAYQVGDTLSVKLPRKHLQYISAKVTVTGGTGYAFEGGLERG